VLRGGTRSEIADRLKHCLTRMTFEETGRHPVIVPIVTKA
jgi:mRNA degradation ribonuclease J1/J2